jgi:hypothetical protein
MIRARRDILIASLIAAAGLAALGWFFLASPGFADPEGIHMLALVLGGLVAFFGLFLTVNFLAAGRLVARLVRGEGVVGRWIIPPDAVQQFLQMEAPRHQPNAWRPSRREKRAGVEVIFGQEYLLLGGRLLPLPTAGLQSIRGIGFDPGPPLTVALATGAYTNVGGNFRRIDEEYRIPVIDPDAANAVVLHFRAALAGQVIVAPNRWLWRIRLGVALMVILPLLGLVGLWLANQPDRTTEAQLILPLTLMILGVVGTIGAAIVTLVALNFHRRQRGGR